MGSILVMKKQLALSVLTALILSLSYAPFKTGFLAFFGLIPFFILLESTRGWETFRWSYFTGFCYALGTLYWIGWVTLPGMIGTLLVWPFFITLYGLGHVRLRKRFASRGWALLPFLWVAIEYLQSRSELAFPWNHLGYTQSFYLPWIQYVEYTSVLGVSFWVMGINLILYHGLWLKQKRTQMAVMLLLMITIPSVHGIWVLSTKEKHEQVSLCLLQGNMDPFAKWADDEEKNMILYEGLMKRARSYRPNLYVWPETATPFYLRLEPEYLQRMEAILDSSQAPVLTGSVDAEFEQQGIYRYFNAALLFTGADSVIQRYAKMKLVPFSEKVPYRDYFPFKEIKKLLYDLIWGIGDYSPGDQYTLFRFYRGHKRYRFAVPICYESAFPDVVRIFCKKGADFLAVITNDAWFGRTSGPYQHLRIAVFRAIENRIGIARCANTGISGFIDAYGSVSGSTRLFEQAIVTGSVDLRRRTTFYTQHGDLFAYVCLGVSALALLGSFIIKKNS